MMAKAKTGSAIKTAHYRSRTAKNDAELAAMQFKSPDRDYQPLFKELNKQFPPKNYRIED